MTISHFVNEFHFPLQPRGRAPRPLTDAKRNRIIAAALPLFAEQGYHGARMDDLAGGASFSTVAYSGAPYMVNGQPVYWKQNGGGNPLLRPWKADTFDLALEKYFSNKGYLSARHFEPS